MTNTTTDAAEARALPVVQADRDAAANVIDTYEGKERYAAMVRAGHRDGHSLCIAFARHRLATAEAASGAGEREAFVRLCEALGIPATAGAYLEVPRILASLPPATDPAMVREAIARALYLRRNPAQHASNEDFAWECAKRHPASYLAVYYADADAALAAAPTILATGERWQHVKRGTVYEVVGEAKVQDAGDQGIVEGDVVVVYRGDDGQLWAREYSEFHDGRFTALATIPATGHAATEGEGA